MLDTEEYFHLALHAGSVGDHHSCMSYLGEVLQQEPRHARATYMLAVQHAELGLTDRAITGIKTALAIEPTLEIARFQLGLLLLLDRNRPQEAKEYLARLSGSSDRSLRTYSEALIAIADSDSALAEKKLAAGLSQTSGNPALSTLMQRLLDRVRRGEEAAARKSGEAEKGNVYLRAYGQTSS